MTITSSKVFKAFAWVCLFVGFAMLMLEAFIHYQQALSRHPLPVSPWSGVSIAMGAILILFGAGVFQYSDTKKALELFGYITPFIVSLIQTVRPGGRRSTDTFAVPVTAGTIAPAGTDETTVAILQAESAARVQKHTINPPLVEGD